MRKRKKTVIAIVAAVLSASTIGLVLLNLVTVDYLAEVETYAPENIRALVLAIIKAESDFDARAKSKKGAVGLMQLMPSTAKGLGVKDPLDPQQNIEGGVKYVKSMLDRFNGNIILALAAYNAGPNAVKKYDGVPPYKETQNYVKSILKNYL